MTHPPRSAARATLLAGLTLIATNLTQAADETALQHEMGTRHRFVQPEGSPYPPVGCNDHRTLMFVVRETEGDDPAAAKLLVARDCRPLVPDAEYIRCGPGGWAYPANADRLSYASYCRVGAKDIALYALDEQMKEMGEDRRPPPE